MRVLHIPFLPDLYNHRDKVFIAFIAPHDADSDGSPLHGEASQFIMAEGIAVKRPSKASSISLSARLPILLAHASRTTVLSRVFNSLFNLCFLVELLNLGFRNAVIAVDVIRRDPTTPNPLILQ